MTELKDPTLHKRIRSDISERILSGAWPPGHRIPYEHELMAEYGCSRMTVNKALAPLAESGLIVRRRKAGSFVARPRIHSVVLDIPDIPAEVTARGEPYGYELQSRKTRVAGRREIEELGLDGPVQVLALRCLHRASGRPFALEERLINLAAVPEAVDRGGTSHQRRECRSGNIQPPRNRAPCRLPRAGTPDVARRRTDHPRAADVSG
jgi:GntR family transcriptional regulator, histidine utilization repressor